MAERNLSVVAMQFGNLSAAFMAACALHRTLHRDNNITFAIYLNALNFNIWDIKRYSIFAIFILTFADQLPITACFNSYLSTTQDTKEPKYDTKTIRIKIEASEGSIHPADGYVYLKVGDFKPFTKPGEPQLPMQTHVLKLPKNAEVIRVAISNARYREIESELNIAPVPQPVSWSENAKLKKEVMPEIIRDEKVYWLDTYFPAVSYDVGYDNEYKYVFVRYYPLQYIPSKKKAILITDAAIKMYYKDEDKGSEDFFSGTFQEASGDSSTDAENISDLLQPFPEGRCLHQEIAQLAN